MLEIACGFDPRLGHSVVPTACRDALDTALAGKSWDSPPGMTGRRRRPQSGQLVIRSGCGFDRSWDLIERSTAGVLEPPRTYPLADLCAGGGMVDTLVLETSALIGVGVRLPFGALDLITMVGVAPCSKTRALNLTMAKGFNERSSDQVRHRVRSRTVPQIFTACSAVWQRTPLGWERS